MTFRVTSPKGSLWQIAQAIVWIGITSSNLRWPHRYGHNLHWLNLFSLIVFSTSLALHLYLYFFATVEFTPDALRIKQALRSVFVPYGAIVSFGPVCDANDIVKKDTVELEIAKLAPEIHPHQYRELQLRDIDGFLTALRQYVPTRP